MSMNIHFCQIQRCGTFSHNHLQSVLIRITIFLIAGKQRTKAMIVFYLQPSILQMNKNVTFIYLCMFLLFKILYSLYSPWVCCPAQF